MDLEGQAKTALFERLVTPHVPAAWNLARWLPVAIRTTPKMSCRRHIFVRSGFSIRFEAAMREAGC